MKPTTQPHVLPVCWIFILSLIVFTYGLRTQEIIGFDSRFYLFALEMWRHGVSWFPSTYHRPYPDYPGTSTFLIYLSAKALGGMNKLVAVLPSAIAASLTLSFTYLIGALQSKRWGLYAVFFLLLTATFLKGARSIALDLYPTLFTTMCFYLVYSADVQHKPTRTWWVYPLLFLGFAFRGPIGLVVPTGVVCVYYLLDKNIKQFFIVGILAVMTLLVGGVILLAIANHVGGTHFVRAVLRLEVLGRLNNNSLPSYFYFIDSLGSYALSFPFAILVMLGVAYAEFITRQSVPDAKLLWKLFGWMMVIMLGMSIPGDKKVRYILPMAPAAALIAASLFTVPFKDKYLLLLRKIGIRFFLYLPIVLALATEVVYFYMKSNNLAIDIHFSLIFAALFIIQITGIYYAYGQHKTVSLPSTPLLMLAAGSLILVNMMVVEPIELYIDSARDFVMAMEAQRIQHHATLIFYKENPDGVPIKYIINMPQEDQIIHIKNQAELLAYPFPAYIVASVENFSALTHSGASMFDIVGNDTLGHTRIVVFANKKALVPEKRK